MNICISKGNGKMGEIPSVSLPAGVTCGNVPCLKQCYARKLTLLRPNVKDSYAKNYQILVSDPDTYWREVNAQLCLSRFFRFHVSGDIPDKEYLRQMIRAAKKNGHCEILCFTKKYDMVNEEIDSGAKLPGNLHLIFSVWKGLDISNPHNLPEAHVRYKDGTTTASPYAIPCNKYSGNCAICASIEGGCWSLNKGEQVVFDEH